MHILLILIVMMMIMLVAMMVLMMITMIIADGNDVIFISVLHTLKGMLAFFFGLI